MAISGEKIKEAYEGWVSSEIKEGPKVIYDLGKFFFSVSLGTAGFIITLEKINDTPEFDTSLVASGMFLFLSMILALYLAIPKVTELNGKTDLQNEYSNIISNGIQNINVWFILWFVGLIFGIFAISR